MARQECSTCFTGPGPGVRFVQCNKGHVVCTDCAGAGTRTALEQLDPSLECVAVGACKGAYPAEVARTFLDKAMSAQVEKLSLGKDTEAVGNFRQCPFCDYGVSFDFPDAHETFECRNPKCLKVSCMYCKKVDHYPLDCEPEPLGSGTKALEEEMSEALIRRCPKCKTAHVGRDGCNMVYCVGCRVYFCYVCKASPITYAHFDLRGGTCYGLKFGEPPIKAEIASAWEAGTAKLTTTADKARGQKLKPKGG